MDVGTRTQICKRRLRGTFSDTFLGGWCHLVQIIRQCFLSITEPVVTMHCLIVLYLRILSADLDGCWNRGRGVWETEPGGPRVEG